MTVYTGVENGETVSVGRTGLTAFVAALAFTLLTWLQQSPFEASMFLRGNDDMVRMVEVRDLLAGQGWFDLLLPRLGTATGTLMHWSRLIDAPLAALVSLGNLFSAGSGERFAAIVWPLLLFAAAFGGLLTGVRRATGSVNVVPSLVIGGFALVGSGIFDSGAIDHHNAQLVLTIWLIACLLPSSVPNRDFAAAGVVIALMMAIGAESLPVAVAGAGAIFMRLLIEGEALIGPVRRFGLSLTVSTAILFALLVGPEDYTSKFCDSFSVFHLVCAGTGGLALYAGFSPSVRRALQAPLVSAPLFAGLCTALLALLFFPDCLRAPGDLLDPKLRFFWFDKVIETQSVFQVAAIDPWLLPYMYVLPLLAAAASLWMIIRRDSPSVYALFLTFIAVTSAVTLFQMRGTQFATPVAAMALSILVTRFAEGSGKKQPLRLLAALAVSCALVWKMIIIGAIALFSDGKTGPLIAAGVPKAVEQCESAASIASLDALTPGLVAGSNNLGPLFLLKTPHRVLSGPYHRNVEGNLAWINAMTGSPEDARSILTNAKADILAICPTEDDELDLSRESPDGFLSQLISGKSFSWLEPVQETMDKPLKLWRISIQG
jgi:hypothetical protein